MKHLLVPVDFSETSITLLNYSINLAKELNTKLTILHVIPVPVSTETGIVAMEYSLPYSIGENRMEVFLEKASEEIGIDLNTVDLETRIEVGSPAFLISSVAKKIDADMIIMGTISKTGLFLKMIGSVTTATINQSKCPVLLIHKNTRYVKPKKMIFGIDKEGNIEDSLETFYDLNSKLRGYTEFVYIDKPENKTLAEVKKEIIEELTEDNQANFSFEIKRVDGNDPSQDLIDYCLFSKADILVLIHREKNFFSRIFSGSTSFRAAEKIHLPIIIIPEN